MANLSSNTNLTIPRGAVVKFGLGGIGQAIDESGTYKLGNQEVILGPYPVAKTITVLVQSTVRYVIDTDGVIDTSVPVDAVAGSVPDSSKPAVRGAVIRSDVLDAATSGVSSEWMPIAAYPERIAYALDSGSTNTTFSIDISADGVSSLGQAFTGTWASTTAEITPPLMFSNPQARYFRFNVITGGPLSVSRGY